MLSDTDLATLPSNHWFSSTALTKALSVSHHHSALLNAIPLTDALKKLHPDFSVQLKFLGSTPVRTDEYTLLGTFAGYGREVQLCLANTPIIWARSVCTNDAKHWQKNMHCGTQTLGSRIYLHPHQRSAFEFACLNPQHHCNPTQQLVLARRSCIIQKHTPLLLIETFLPTIKQFMSTNP